MPVLTITNLTARRLPVDSRVGVLEANQQRSVELTGAEAEAAATALTRLAAAGLIVWTGAPTTTLADNAAEPVFGGSPVLRGAGDPNGVVSGYPGDLYTDGEGGVGTTLYVKESGAGTDTGWVAK